MEKKIMGSQGTLEEIKKAEEIMTEKESGESQERIMHIEKGQELMREQMEKTLLDDFIKNLGEQQRQFNTSIELKKKERELIALYAQFPERQQMSAQKKVYDLIKTDVEELEEKKNLFTDQLYEKLGAFANLDSELIKKSGYIFYSWREKGPVLFPASHNLDDKRIIEIVQKLPIASIDACCAKDSIQEKLMSKEVLGELFKKPEFLGFVDINNRLYNAMSKSLGINIEEFDKELERRCERDKEEEREKGKKRGQRNDEIIYCRNFINLIKEYWEKIEK